MSRGSTLSLFVDNRIGGLTTGLHEMYIENHKDELFVKHECHPRFYHTHDVFEEVDRGEECPVVWDMIDSETGKTYTRVLEFTFTSSFGELVEGLHLNPYDPSHSLVTIGTEMARQMLKAIEYLLLKKYDSDIEEVLDNEYIEVFGECIKEYRDHQYRKKFPNDTEYVSDDEDDRYALINFRTVLRAFLDTYDNSNLLLTYEAWG